MTTPPSLRPLAGFALGCLATAALFAAAGSPAWLKSGVFRWEDVKFVPGKTGQRAQVIDLPTGTLSKLHCHISLLNPGENTGALHRHPQEELIVVKEGTLEVNFDGRKQTAGPGALVFFSVNENENMTNVGAAPAVYYVFQWFTPLTPKG